MGQLADRQAIHAELERAGAEFAALVDRAGPGDLRRPTDGTRWTNQQLLLHMLFGYLIVRTLLGLVRMFGRLPDSCSRVFAAGLNAGTRPFHAVNYLVRGGALVFRGPRLVAKFDRVIASLHRRLDAETDAALGRVMQFPTRWDPFFTDRMSLANVYHYGTQH